MNTLKLLNSTILESSKHIVDASKEVALKPILFIEDLSLQTCEKFSPKDLSDLLNKNWQKLGIKTSTSLKDSVITINEENLNRILHIANSNSATVGPNLTILELNNSIALLKTVQKKSIPILLKLSGISSKYWFVKQYSYQAISAWHIYTMKNAAASAAAKAGIAALTPGSILALSFSLSIFLSLLESHVPVGRVKNAIKLAKLVSGAPVICAEYTVNGIMGVGESVFFKRKFPTNITSVYGILDGPELDKMPGFKNAIGQVLWKMWEKQ